AELLGELDHEPTFFEARFLRRHAGRAVEEDAAMRGDALELDARQRFDQSRKRFDAVDIRVGETTAMKAAVDLDLDPDLHAALRGHLADALDGGGAVDVDRHLRFASQSRKTLPLGASDHRVRDDHIAT